jgi:hypothetical protein
MSESVTGHPPDDPADFALQNKLGGSYVAFRGVSIAPGGKFIPAPPYQCCSYDKSEDRTPKVAATGAALAPVLG